MRTMIQGWGWWSPFHCFIYGASFYAVLVAFVTVNVSFRYIRQTRIACQKLTPFEYPSFFSGPVRGHCFVQFKRKLQMAVRFFFQSETVSDRRYIQHMSFVQRQRVKQKLLSVFHPFYFYLFLLISVSRNILFLTRAVPHFLIYYTI